MQETSTLYRQIVAGENHWFERSVVIGESGVLITKKAERILFGGTAIVVSRSAADSGYHDEKLLHVETSLKMFDKTPVFGKAVSAEIHLKILKPYGELPPMAQVIPYVRACDKDNKSEWIQQGVFFIDEREETKNDDGLEVLTITGYDAIMQAGVEYEDSGTLDWSGGTVLDTEMVGEIAGQMGVSVDPRTWDIMTDAFQIPLPAGYTLREILGYIAGAYAGCFIMNDVGELRLVSISGLPRQTNLLIDQIGDYITFGGQRIML